MAEKKSSESLQDRGCDETIVNRHFAIMPPLISSEHRSENPPAVPDGANAVLAPGPERWRISMDGCLVVGRLRQSAGGKEDEAAAAQAK
jgi:hypothetical protein